MKFNESKQQELSNLLQKCSEKFGEYMPVNDIHTYGCQSCTGSCMGHGISVWTACDVK